DSLSKYLRNLPTRISSSPVKLWATNAWIATITQPLPASGSPTLRGPARPLLDGEPVRDQERLGAAVARRGRQLKRAAAVGLGSVATAVGVRHGPVAAGGSGR